MFGGQNDSMQIYGAIGIAIQMITLVVMILQLKMLYQ
jgi:hypothetical protein